MRRSPSSQGRAQTCPVLAARLRPQILRVTAGLDPAVHADCGSERPNRLIRSSLSSAWIAGSSPAMTAKEKGRRSAERRMHPVSAPFLPWGGGVEAIHRRQACAVGATYLLGDRSPSGAPLRRLPRRANARTQPRPRFTRNTMRRRYLRLESRLSEAPRAPVVMPEGSMPGPPGSGVTSPARRNRTRSINWLSPVDVPDVSETARLWSSRRQSQRVCICADESGPSALRDLVKP